MDFVVDYIYMPDDGHVCNIVLSLILSIGIEFSSTVKEFPSNSKLLSTTINLFYYFNLGTCNEGQNNTACVMSSMWGRNSKQKTDYEFLYF